MEKISTNNNSMIKNLRHHLRKNPITDYVVDFSNSKTDEKYNVLPTIKKENNPEFIF